MNHNGMSQAHEARKRCSRNEQILSAQYWAKDVPKFRKNKIAKQSAMNASVVCPQCTPSLLSHPCVRDLRHHRGKDGNASTSRGVHGDRHAFLVLDLQLGPHLFISRYLYISTPPPPTG